MQTIAIIGAGAFGTALAIAASRAGRNVVLYGRDANQIAEIERSHINAPYLPDVVMPPSIKPVSLLIDVQNADVIMCATPTQSTRLVLEKLAIIIKKSIIKESVPLILTAKGIERETGLYPSQIAASILPKNPIALLSGPSFAVDVAKGLPTAVALGCADIALAERLAKTLNSNTFRVYHTQDIRGVEIGGASKNVLAIAAGIVEGQGLGESAKATLIARGFAEIGRFAQKSGAKMETLMGLSGLGDLVLTCSSDRSRNFNFGKNLGQGNVQSTAQLVEGAFTAGILCILAAQLKVDMPISNAVAAIIAGQISVREAIEQLTSRPQKAE